MLYQADSVPANLSPAYFDYLFPSEFHPLSLFDIISITVNFVIKHFSG